MAYSRVGQIGELTLDCKRSAVQHREIRHIAMGCSGDDAANAARLAQLWTGHMRE